MKSKIVSLFFCVVIVFNSVFPVIQITEAPSLSSGGSGGLADSPWPMFRQNLNHTGLSPYDTSANNGQLKWSFTANWYIDSSPAIASDGTIYIGSYDKKLYAINSDGSEKWNFTTEGSIKQSSPAIDIDGTIYIGSSDKKIYAINPDGSQKWNFTTGGAVRSSPAIGSTGTIYVGSWDGKLYAINPDGTQKWNFITNGGIRSSPAISSDGTIYIGSRDHKLYAINQNGTEKWSYYTPGYVISSPAIGFNGTIYVGSTEPDPTFHAINPDGTRKWSFNTGSGVLSSPAIGSAGTIYFGAHPCIYAINPDGSEKWKFMTGNSVTSSPTIGSDGTIYIGSQDDKVYAINPDGSEKWNFTTNGAVVHSSPAIGPDGTIYIGSRDYKFYAIGAPSTPPTANAGPNQTVNEGEVVQLNGSASYDPDGSIESYEWDFESDGVYDYLETSSNAPDGVFDGMTSNIYGDDGTYTITLTVEDDDGANASSTTEVKVNNVDPAIDSFGPFSANEGSQLNIQGNAADLGSDDLTFTWNWGDGTSTVVNTHYNDGTAPEPLYDSGTNEVKSPLGTHPFSATDSVSHTYGDDGVYTVTLTVSDDDGGETSYETTVTVNNAAPVITLMITYPDDEGSQVTFEAEATDPGSDDLTFSWEFEYGPTITHTFYNNGLSPDPSQSPLGTYPFSASDTLTHTYGDNYNYTLILTVTDDDGSMTTYSTTVSVDNVAPSIIGIMYPFVAYEGQSAAYGAVVYDEGSDDLTFEWNFGDSTPIITNTYYNDGTGPDPYPSPDGTYPFYASDTLNHTYGDNGVYYARLTVTDDDGDKTIYNLTTTVNNVAPMVDALPNATIDEDGIITFSGHATDPGSDDLIFTWDWGYTGFNDTINTYLNNPPSPDPYPSPDVNPRDVINSVSQIYGDNGVFLITLTVTDDDGGETTVTTTLTVNNVAPTIINIEAYINVNFTLRVAGEKWHSVNIILDEDDVEIWNAQVTRQPGSPDEQTASLSGYRINLGSSYRVVVDYLPNDPRVNGQVWGGNPVWIILEFQDGTSERLHHTFNVRKSYWDSDHWNHIDPWEVNLTSIIYRHNITFKATATDPGSDDLIFVWDFGNGGMAGPNTYFNNGVSLDPYPSPKINPMSAIDTVMHTYSASGIYTITLTVMDDDGGIATTTFVIVLPG